MLNLNATSLRASLGDAAANAVAGGAAPASANDPAGFASLLRQTRSAAVPMPAAPAEAKPATNDSAPSDEASNEADAPQESNDPTRRTRALPKARPRAADRAAPTPPAEKPEGHTNRADQADTPATEVCNEPQTHVVAAETSPIDPGVMHWLAGLQRAASGASGDADGKSAAADADAPVAGSRTVRKGPSAADMKADAGLQDKAAPGKARLADAAGAGPFTAALAEQRTAEKTAQPPVGIATGAKEAAAAAASALAPMPSAGAEAASAPPAAVAIATPVTAPDFAHALGLRLAVLAKDGVQTAELHLNPADMGPVSVQIVMDGTQARVDFGADLAATRQAIEAGLPELASALRDAGFTLAGGGVSQHAGGRSGGQDSGVSDGRRERGITAEDDVKRVATAARRIVNAGGIDLFV